MRNLFTGLLAIVLLSLLADSAYRSGYISGYVVNAQDGLATSAKPDATGGAIHPPAPPPLPELIPIDAEHGFGPDDSYHFRFIVSQYNADELSKASINRHQADLSTEMSLLRQRLYDKCKCTSDQYDLVGDSDHAPALVLKKTANATANTPANAPAK